MKRHFSLRETLLEDAQKANLFGILYRLLKELADMDTEKDIYSVILDAAAEAIPEAELGSILIIRGEYMEYAASFGLNETYLSKIRLKTKDTLLYKETEGRMDKAVIIEGFSEKNALNCSEQDYELLRKAGSSVIRSSLSVPITSNKRTVGSLHLDSSKSGVFQSEDIRILEVFALELAGLMRLVENIEMKNYLLRYDDMTGIFNRRYASQLIKAFVEEAEPFVLVSMDMNDLKLVNDTMGHEMGDEYINYFVQAVGERIEEETVFARYGGDEFILVFPGGNPTTILFRMREIEEFFMRDGRFRKMLDIDSVFSYGIVSFPQEAKDYNSLLRLADERMYLFKREFKRRRRLMQG
ncbi:MAG: sensor domain-containing diguanylate cyclase [Peptostreptococcaceae bacterium]|nr:sensor domain-containing diguanylate cyclase [Peptostreptococcaceae bacterium]